MEGQDKIRTVTAEIYEVCPESNATNFFLSKYLFPNNENHTIWRVMVWIYTPFFHKVSVHFLRPLMNEEQVCVCHVGTLPCPVLVVSISLHNSLHQSWTSYHGSHPAGLQIGGWRVDVVPLSNRVFFNGFPRLCICMEPCTVMLKQDFCWIVVNLNLFETLPEFCQCPDVGVKDDCFPCWHHIHTNPSFTVSVDSDPNLAY